MEKQTRLSSIIMLIIATVFWGGTFTLSKVLVDNLPPFAIVGLRSLGTALFVLVFFFKVIKLDLQRSNFFKINNFAKLDKLVWLFGLINGGALLLQTKALNYTTPGNAAFITAFAVLLVPIVKQIHYGAKANLLIYTAVFISLIGIYFISFGFSLPTNINFGDFLVFLCAILYGYYIVFMEKLSKKYSAPFIVFSSFLIAGVMGIFAEFIYSGTFNVHNLVNINVSINMVLLVVLGGVVPYMLMAKGQRHISAELAAIIYLFEPVFAIIISYFWIHEEITKIKILGCSLILIALIFGILGEKHGSTSNRVET